MSKLERCMSWRDVTCVFCKEPVADQLTILQQGKSENGFVIMSFCTDCGTKFAKDFGNVEWRA